MDVPEQLPDISLVSTLEAEKRIVVEVDFLFSYLYPHLHGDVFKAPDKSLSYILQVVVTENQEYTAIKTIEHLSPFGCASKTEVSEMEDDVIIADRLIPVSYQCLVHLCRILERPLAVADYICVVEVGVRYKKHPPSVKFEIHC